MELSTITIHDLIVTFTLCANYNLTNINHSVRSVDKVDFTIHYTYKVINHC